MLAVGLGVLTGAFLAGLAASLQAATPAEALRERGLRIRVKLSQMADAAGYQVRSDQGLRFVAPSGQLVFETKGGETFLVSPQAIAELPDMPPPPASPTTCWRIALKRFGERRGAELYAQSQALDLSLQLDIIETASPGSARRFALVVGKFPSRALAERALKMIPQARGAEIISGDPGRSQPRRHPAVPLRILDAKKKPVGQTPPAGVIVQSRRQDAIVWLVAGDVEGGFHGEIQFCRGDDGALFPVNRVGIEAYVQSVVPAEIGDFAPYEALKAQAIAARSEAIHKVLAGGRYGDERYDVVSTQQDQVYRGIEAEAGDASRAVRETAGQALVRDGEVIDAVYSHSCGGITASSEDLWPGRPVPYLRSQVDRMNWIFPADLSSEDAVREWIKSTPDVYCNALQEGFPEYAKPYFRWRRTVGGAEIAGLVNDRGYSIGRLTDLRIVRRTVSGRVAEMEFCGTDRTVRLRNGDTIRVLLGLLPSTFLVMNAQKKDNAVDTVTFEGAGYGHGVGLCQMGAFMMGRRGYDCDKILHHYFAGVEIEKVY